MSVGWSSEAQAAILAGCRVLFTYHIDIEQGGGVWGLNIIDVTDRVQEDGMGRIKKTSSVIEKDWELTPTTVLCDNADAYFTPNMVLGSRDQLENIWQSRASGEADPRDCILVIKQVVWLTDGTTETKERFKGKIIELNPIIDEGRISMELVARIHLVDDLDSVFTTEDGFSTSHDIP